MTKTKYYDLQMDDPQDDYDVEVVNANLKKIDEQMKIRENATDALQEPEFTVADKRENIASKEKISKILGKIAKFFADLKAVAFTGNYNDLSDKPTSLPANGGNSDTVNSHTVESNVPKNAKFTDTTYSDATTTTHGLMSATDKKLLDVLNKPLATCATGQATAAKVATLQNFTLQVGSTVVVKFTGTGTANPTSGNLTLNVNGTGARIMGYFRNGNKAAISYVSGNFFCSNATHIFTYDGTYWLCMDWNLDNNTTYSNFVKSGTGAKAGLVPAPSTTAGTTKYLREDGAWKTPPDTKTSVVNNNTTTEPGSALDARQANPNIEGTMAASIAQLNSNLKIEVNPNATIVNGTGEILNYKCGNLSMMSIEITPSKITHGLILATGIYTPVRSFYLSFTTIDGHVVPLVLNFNGELSIYYPYQSIESSVERIDGSFAYICA
jgi:hypothetical protein